MGRHVDTSWYDTYVQSRVVEQSIAEGPLSDPELAGLLGLKPKTWARVKAAGRFLEGLKPGIDREHIQCGSAPLERLAKLWSTAPDMAQELLDAVLSNQLKLADLETLMRGDAQALPDTDATRPSRNTAQKYALFSDWNRILIRQNCTPSIRIKAASFDDEARWVVRAATTSTMHREN